MKHIDAVIIGGSLAGAACARELTRRGIDAVAFERERFPREKVCGGFLSPGAVDILDGLGFLDSLHAAGAATVRSARVRMGKREMQFDLPRFGMGVSRKTLDAILANHPAVRPGAVRAVQRVRGGFRIKVDECEVSARIVIDAAGKLSRFTPRRTSPQFGVQFYEPASGGDVLEFWFFEGGYGGTVHVEGSRSNACFLLAGDTLRKLLARTKDFHFQGEGRIEACGRIDPLRSLAARALPLEGGGESLSCECFTPPSRGSDLRLSGSDRPGFPDSACNAAWRVTGPMAYDKCSAGFIAIGDAVGMVDPFCGEGMRHALDTGVRAARIVAEGFARGHDYDAMRQRYERECDLEWKGSRRFGRLVRQLIRYPRLTAAGFHLNPEYWLRKLWA